MSISNEMLEKLHIGFEYMESDLISEIKQFEDYSYRTKPLVTVLCSENRQRMAMNTLVNDIDEIDFYVCGTYNDEDLDEVKNKALYTDVIIVNTTALKIAPKGLYDVLESVSKINKEIYIILSGWASLPKTKELCGSKIKKAIENFPFSKINACMNVYDKPIDGFVTMNVAMKEYVEKIMFNYEHTHKIQENDLYIMLQRKIRNVCDVIADNIRFEEKLFDTLQTIIEFKKRRYEITFSNNTVNINDVLLSIENSINQIGRDEVIYNIEKEMGMSAKEAFLYDPFNVKYIAKKYVSNTFINIISEYKKNDNLELTIKCNSRISAVTDDLTSVLSNISKCKFVDALLLNKLMECINGTETLNANSEFVGCSFSEVISKVLRVIEPKIMSFEYNNNQKSFPNLFNTLLSNADSIMNRFPDQDNDIDDLEADEYNDLSENNEFGKNKIDNNHLANLISEEIKGTVEKNKDDEAWTLFQNEIDRLITESKAALSSLIYDYTKVKINEVSEQSRIVISEYFEKIIGQLKVISASYNNLIKRIEDSFL